MSQIVDLGIYPRGQYKLNIQNIGDNFEFCIGDFEKFSYPNLNYISPYYEIMQYDEKGQEIGLKAINYIDVPRNYLFNEFSSVTDLNINNKGFTKDNLFILDSTEYKVKIYNSKPNIYDFFTQNQLNNFYTLKEFDYWTSYNLGIEAYPDYISPIASYTQYIPEYIERIFFNIDVHYGRSHIYFKKIVEYMEHFLNWEINPKFYNFINQFHLFDKVEFIYYKGIEYLEHSVYDYMNKIHFPYYEKDYKIFNFKDIYSYSFQIKKNDYNLLFEKLGLNSFNAESFLIGGLGQVQYNLSTYLKENYNKLQFKLFSSTLIKAPYFSYFFYTQNHIFNDVILDENSNEIIRINSSDTITIHCGLLKDNYLDNLKKVYDASGLLGENLTKVFKCCLVDCFKTTKKIN